MMLNVKMKQRIPWLMAAARGALGPVMVIGQACQWNGFALAGTILAALLSDIYDGVLARRWHCDTPAVRLFDSMADTVSICVRRRRALSRPAGALACA
jgi:CDP-diacylglycerol--glycerol-3-phosphate 3-phosphatidyltransferase